MTADQTSAAHAHVLMQVEPGRCTDAVAYVRSVPGVALAAQTSGPFDVIAEVSGDVPRVLALLRRTPGLWATRVCRRA